MKRRTIITSVLVIVLCLGLISGSTFALFTSESSVNIAVTSGKVNVVATIDDTSLKVYSATADPTGLSQEELADVAGTLTGTFAGTYYYDKLDGTTFTNGGTVTLTDTKTLKIDKITPGDKVEVIVSVENNSNVKTKYRIKVNVLDGETLEDQAKSLKLFEGLTVKVGTEELKGVIRVSNWTTLPAREPNSDYNLADIPVEIFLPLKAGNEYQDLKTEIQITVEAVQSNAATNTELELINAYLAEQEPTTMNAAIKSLVNNTSIGLTTTLADYAAAFEKVGSYLWNVDTNQFYAESDATDFAYKYFKVYDAMPTTAQTYSIYAAGSAWQATSVTGLTVGFDAGETTGITSVTYNRSTAEYGQDIVIRTNSAGTSLTINAPKDVVKHYGVAGTIEIIATANSSYHEYGNVLFLEVSKGRVALENNSNVVNVHINAKVENNIKQDEFDSIIVSMAESITKPTFSRDDVKISQNGTLVVAIQKGTGDVTEETPLDYVWLTKQGIFEQIKISESDTEITANAQWADELTSEKEKTQKAALEIANNINRDSNDNIDVKVSVTESKTTKKYQVALDANRNLVVVEENAAPNTEPVATIVTPGEVQINDTKFTVELSNNTTDNSTELKVTNQTTSVVQTVTAVEQSGLTEEEKETAKNAECDHPIQYRTVVDLDNVNHKIVCSFCGYSVTEMHNYNDDCRYCTVCNHANVEKVTLSHGETSVVYDKVSEAVAAYNDAITENEPYTLTFGPGIYNLNVNQLLIIEDPAKPSKTLTIQGTKQEDTYYTIIKPAYLNDASAHAYYQYNKNNGIFCVSGMSSFNGGGVTVQDLKFDMTQNMIPGATGSIRLFAVYCLAGGSGSADPIFPEVGDNTDGYHRYAHDITVQNCDFEGPGGKFASVVGANQTNCSPSAITIKNNTGKKLNCWFNGYVGTNKGFGLKIENCQSSEFLVVCNIQSNGTTLDVTNVDGSFFYDDNNDNISTEKFLIKTGGEYRDNTLNIVRPMVVKISGCDWTLLSKSNSTTHINSGVLTTSGPNVEFNIVNTRLTRYEEQPSYPFIRTDKNNNYYYVINGENVSSGTWGENVSEFYDYWIYYASNSFKSGTGTETDPYMITSAEELSYMAKYITGYSGYGQFAGTPHTGYGEYFKLANDIDLTGKIFSPIGDKKDDRPFAGNFDGGKYTITGLTLRDREYSALFSQTIDATIKNFTITGTANAENVAGVIGQMNGGLLEKVTNYVNVTTNAKAGGLVVLARGAYVDNTQTNAVIKDCKNYGTVYSEGDGNNSSGGIVAMSNLGVEIDGCINYGNINRTYTSTGNTNSAAGGILGWATKTSTALNINSSNKEVTKSDLDASSYAIVKNCICDSNATVYCNLSGCQGRIYGGRADQALVISDCTPAVNN